MGEYSRAITAPAAGEPWRTRTPGGWVRLPALWLMDDTEPSRRLGADGGVDGVREPPQAHAVGRDGRHGLRQTTGRGRGTVVRRGASSRLRLRALPQPRP